jgi:hypothetical protein
LLPLASSLLLSKCFLVLFAVLEFAISKSEPAEASDDVLRLDALAFELFLAARLERDNSGSRTLV